MLRFFSLVIELWPTLSLGKTVSQSIAQQQIVYLGRNYNFSHQVRTGLFVRVSSWMNMVLTNADVKILITKMTMVSSSCNSTKILLRNAVLNQMGNDI
jgi:hypothetical protein